jgi:hypothetical protein
MDADWSDVGSKYTRRGRRLIPSAIIKWQRFLHIVLLHTLSQPIH